MNLYEMDEKKKKTENEKKLNKNMTILIIITVIIIVALYIGIKVLKNNPSSYTVKIDGKVSSTATKLIDLDNIENGVVLVPIKEFAQDVLGFNSYNGKPDSTENTDSCYAENDFETVIFEKDSNIIYKKSKENKDSEYEIYELEKNILKNSDGNLYIYLNGLDIAFNLNYVYDKNKKTLYIDTIEYETSIASKQATAKKYDGIDDKFNNLKAISKDNMVVVYKGTKVENSKETQFENLKYGIIDYTTGAELLSPQYEEITYVPQKSYFFVKKNGKVGMIKFENGEKKTVFEEQYDSLELIDSENELYLVSNESKYGVINETGIVIYTDYDSIGIDKTKYSKNNVKSGYVLLGKYIPVMQNGKWGFFDISGYKITNLDYDDIGCVKTNQKNTTYNLVQIEEHNTIIAKKGEKYGGIYLDNKKYYEIIPFVVDEVYMEIENGETKYLTTYMNNEKQYTANIIDIIEAVFDKNN